jgi:hypothetical protein
VIHSSGAKRIHADRALCGALAGAVLVLTLSIWDILSGRYDASDPFVHAMIETTSAAAGGAALSVLLSLIYRLFVARP